MNGWVAGNEVKILLAQLKVSLCKNRNMENASSPFSRLDVEETGGVQDMRKFFQRVGGNNNNN